MRFGPRSSLSASALLLTLAAAWTTPAQASWNGEGAPVSTVAGSNQLLEVALADGAGGAFFVYRHIADLRAQRLDASGAQLWGSNGVLVCNAAGTQDASRICSDAAGGFIVCWSDARTDAGDIYAQRFNASGVAQWAANGVVICNATDAQFLPAITIDNSGGAIVAWEDARSAVTADDIWAQRIDAAGVVQWTANGVQLTAAAGNQNAPEIITYPAGGAIVIWDDRRSGTADIYGRRLGLSGSLSWAANGTAICTAVGSQTEHALLNDGSTGAIICWQDARGADLDIYAQRVNSAGTSQWAANGEAVCNAADNQSAPAMVADGGGGVVIAWPDRRSGDTRPFAQRLNASGVAQWAANGVQLGAMDIDGFRLPIVSDGASGAIVAWMDIRTSSAEAIPFARRVDASGNALWAADGTALMTETITGNDLTYAVSDGAGGMIAAWIDDRDGALVQFDVYASRVRSNGNLADFDPAIASVADLPADQGGWVRLAVTSPVADAGPSTPEVTGYNVWRKIVPAPMSPHRAMRVAGESPLARSVRERVVLDPLEAEHAGFPPGSWESMGFHAALQAPSYTLTAPTRDDFIGMGATDETYVVSVHTTTPSLFGVTAASIGFSTDNLPPAMPQNLAGNKTAPTTVQITWSANLEGDLSHYAVYKGADATFVPGPGNRLGEPSSTGWTDGAFAASYYKISAIDIHLNESPFALLGPGQIVGVNQPIVPGTTSLHFAPNPTRGATLFAVRLSEAGAAELRVYDAGGRWVRTLLQGTRPAGEHFVAWDARDSQGRRVPPGIYLASLHAARSAHTRRVVMLE